MENKDVKNLDDSFVFEKSALRVSALPYYDCGDLVFVKKYMDGEILDESFNEEWHNDLKNWSKAGKKIQRIRVLPTEFTDYNRFEVMAYQMNILAGEEYFFINEKQYNLILKDYNLSGDFWILDDYKVLKLIYDDKNDYVRTEVDIENVDKYLAFYNKLLENTFSSKEWLSKIRSSINF